MATINQSSGQGALFELVARGNKDAYFLKDSKESSFPYDASYESSAHHLAERKTFVPLNAVTWGNSFEVEIDPYGDIMTECEFEIELPSWYPDLPLNPPAEGQLPTSCYPPSVVNGLYPITTKGVNPRSYGYVNYVAYFLFEKIQFYQDQFLIQEWSGDGLLAQQLTEGSYNTSFLQQELGGLVNTYDTDTNLPTVRGLQLRATPRQLKLKLPLPGLQCPGDGGFPFVALPWQKFRIRATLRKLEDLVVCSNPTISKENPLFYPWYEGNEFSYTTPTGVYDFPPQKLNEIGQPTILLSTVQHYVPPRVQEELRSTPIQIPFRRQYENNFTFGELDYIPLDKGGTAAVTRRLDGRHPAERLFWFFRTQNSLDKNQLDNFSNDYFQFNPPTATQPYPIFPPQIGSSYVPTPAPAPPPLSGSFFYVMKLIIAGRDRENLHEPFVWQNISQLAKDEKANGQQIGEMKWSTGDNFGTIYPAPRQPEGTVNFTTADRPTLYLELANIRSNPLIAQRKSEFRVFIEGWNVYDVREGRGRLLFAS
jgi:hypothetical protein